MTKTASPDHSELHTWNITKGLQIMRLVTGTNTIGEDAVMSPIYTDEFELWQTARRLSRTTVTERARILRQFHTKTHVQPAHAQPVDIMRWFADHDDWSQATAYAYYAALNSFYKWMQLQGYRDDNPLLKVGAPKQPERLPRPISDRDLQALLGTATMMTTHAMVLLAALQGLRVHEIAKFRAEHINLDRQILSVKGKGGKLSDLPLHPMVADWSRRMPARGWWFPSRFDPTQHVQAKSVSRSISDLMRQNGVSGTPHALRHYFATKLLADGADLLTVRDLLRHKNLSTTTIYAQLPDGVRREAIDRLDPWSTPHLVSAA